MISSADGLDREISIRQPGQSPASCGRGSSTTLRPRRVSKRPSCPLAASRDCSSDAADPVARCRRRAVAVLASRECDRGSVAGRDLVQVRRILPLLGHGRACGASKWILRTLARRARSRTAGVRSIGRVDHRLPGHLPPQQRQASRIADTYVPNEAALGLPSAKISPHPGEAQIVTEALATQRPRLLAELDEAMPEQVVTLGNAALRVFATLIDPSANPPPAFLTRSSYGEPMTVEVNGRSMSWLPLIHPGARFGSDPQSWPGTHQRWIAERAPDPKTRTSEA